MMNSIGMPASPIKVDELAANWLNPPAIFRPAPFWSWNSKLEISRLCRQIDSMHNAGMGGFFMHSRYGLKTQYLSDEWFACIRACVEKAKSLDMKAYLYDEDRWPSGSNGGNITRNNTEYRTQFVSCRFANEDDRAEQGHLGVFNVQLDDKGFLNSYTQLTNPGQDVYKGGNLAIFDINTQQPSQWENDGTYLDTMNPDAVGEFIRQTHQEYKERFEKDFGGIIPAIFTDEPNYGYWQVGRKGKNFQCPWSRHLREEFTKRRGYDLLPYLPEVIFTKADQAFSKTRYDYFRTLSELFVESFTKQIGDWCADNSLILTGHVLWEEPLSPQVSAVGSCMPHYEYMQWPGVDMLLDQADQLATVKQCTSVADQLGKERVLSELYGCTGWDWPLEGHKFIADWQFAGGVNFLCPHLSHYSLAGGAKRDCPASLLDHSPWWPYYKTVEDYLSRVSFMLSQGKSVRDILVIHSIESVWGSHSLNRTFDDDIVEELQPSLKSVIYGLTENHYDWDFGDESLIAKYGKINNGRLMMCNMQYKVVVIPPVITLRSTTIELLDQFVKSGGIVMSVLPSASLVDGLPSTQLESLLANSRSYESSQSMVMALEKLLPRQVSIKRDGKECNQIWSFLKQIDDNLMLFAQSQDRKANVETTIRIKKAQEPVIFWDALAGEKWRIDAKLSADVLEFSHRFDPSGSAVFTFGLDVPDARELHPEGKVLASNSFDGPFEVELTEPNTLPLDYCRYKFESDEYSELMPTLKADEIIRKRFGLSTRQGVEQQPYYLYANGNVDTRPRGFAQMVFSFHITEIPSSCNLAIENPQDFEIKVNGNCVSEINGFWVDEDFKTIKIQSFLQKGINEICLEFNYRTDMELEDLYLTGDFGVQRIDAAKTPAPDNMTLVGSVKELKLGSWVGQGMDFYSGAVKYKIPFKPCIKNKNRTFIRLEDLSCTAAVIHVGEKSFVLPWAPFVADITEAINPAVKDIIVEVIGGRKNILGPLHVFNPKWIVPGCFSPNNEKWTFEYHLNHHGIGAAVVVESRE
jgi:hypothetical protein